MSRCLDKNGTFLIPRGHGPVVLWDDERAGPACIRNVSCLKVLTSFRLDVLSKGYLEKPILDVVFAHIFLVYSIVLIAEGPSPGASPAISICDKKPEERVRLDL
jgi:hypothetical protein